MAVKGKRRTRRLVTEFAAAAVLTTAAIWAVTTYGLHISPILSDSMKPVFQRGDTVLTVNTDTRTPHIGDVIVFTAQIAEGVTKPVIHRWTGTRPDGSLITQGDNNPQLDPYRVTAADVTAVQITAIPTHYFRAPWVIPTAGAVLGFVIITSIIMAATRKKNDDEDENHVAPDSEPTAARRVFTRQTATAQETALAADKAHKKQPLPEPAEHGDEPVEPTVRVIPAIPADNTFHDIIEEATRPQPVIPDGWTPNHTALPADPADIYLAPKSEPHRPERAPKH